MTVPALRFTSDMMWVDESSAKLYIAYHGHVLRLHLRAFLWRTQTKTQ